jgi:Zn-dependent protease with chaperone function
VTDALVAMVITAASAWLAWLLPTLAPAFIMRAHEGIEALVDQAPLAHRLLAELAASAGIVRPRLFVFKSPHPNGFAIASRHGGAVVVTDAVFERLNEEQLRGLLALLITCLARRAVRTETTIAAIALTLRPLVLPSALARWVLPGRRWFEIDRAAAALAGSDAIAAALAALDAAVPASTHGVRAGAVCSLYCVAPATATGRFARSLGTQPPTRERIACVRREANG